MSREQLALRAKQLLVETKNRKMSDEERAEARTIVEQVRDYDILAEIEKLGTYDGTAAASLSGELRRKGFSLAQAAEVDPSAVFGVKALGDADEASILRPSGIIEEGLDKRYLYANLPAQNPGQATSVDVLVSDSRSLGADVDDIDSTASKGQTDSGASLQHVKMARVATISDYYPNAIVDLDAFRQLVDADMRSAIREALDAYAVAALADGAGEDSSIGSSTYEQLRKAMSAIQGNGFAPNLAAISPGDAEDLDLERGTNEGQFVLSPSPRDSAVSPLWGMLVVVAKNVPDGEPVVMDTSGVEFYLGNLTFAADALTKFDTNESRFRLEGPTLLVVRQPGAVAAVAASS